MVVFDGVGAAVFQRQTDALASLPHSGLEQAHGGVAPVLLLDGSDVDLNLDEVAVDSVDRGVDCLVASTDEHAFPTFVPEGNHLGCDRTHGLK